MQENRNNRRPTQLRIDIRVKQFVIGLHERFVEDIADWFRRVQRVILEFFLKVFSLFEINVLIRLFLMKAETICPFRPWPSHTQKSFTPWGSDVSTMATSWFVFSCFPLVPAFVLTATSILLENFLMGSSFFFLPSSKVALIELTEASKCL